MKTLSQTVVALILVELASSLAFAQQTVDFSGTWVLDRSKSELPKRQGRGGTAAEAQEVSGVSWDGSKLVITSTRAMKRPKGETGELRVDQKEVWSLSANGRVLIFDGTGHTPRGDRTAKAVFTKQ
jgi:hypothetical protein